VTEKPPFPHSGRELQLMLEGSKPMAIFYRAVGDEFDETDGQPFREYVASGQMTKTTFFITNEGCDFRMRYTTYALPGEEWRAGLYRQLKRIGQTRWNEDLETIERILLGYSIGDA
jgi:hypothetical protein